MKTPSIIIKAENAGKELFKKNPLLDFYNTVLLQHCFISGFKMAFWSRLY